MEKRPASSHPDVLPDAATARVLARASELDALRSSGSSVAELRAAAAEAGISPEAFDAALAELHDTPASKPVAPTRSPRRLHLRLGATAIALIVGGTLLVGRMLVPARVNAPAPPVAGMIEEAILVRCGSPGEAATLIRPLLRSPTNILTMTPRAPRVLTIRATPEQMQRVKAALDEYQRGESASCTVPQGAATTP
jgi:hypothetical protein